MNRSARGVLGLFLVFGCAGNALSQSYPPWFLRQLEACGKDCFVGYAKPYQRQDSSADQAFLNGCVNYARQQHTHLSGGQAFLNTAMGAFWLGSDIHERFDTTVVEQARQRLKIIDLFHSDQLVAVLLSAREVELAGAMRPSPRRATRRAPGWTQKLPEDPRYEYATGVAQPYYYEPSSWLEAEKTARKKLANSLATRLRMLEKQRWQYQSLVDESLDIHLRHIEVVARWRCWESGLFYVLLRVPREKAAGG